MKIRMKFYWYIVIAITFAGIEAGLQVWGWATTFALVSIWLMIEGALLKISPPD